MPSAVAINVGANTTLPGFRGPVFPDGSFEYIPIPEREPAGEQLPTYADLDLTTDVPADVRDAAVHLDPEFAEYPECEAYTYGDDHAVKAGPLSELAAGDYALFYATLSTAGDPADWAAPEWGAYLIGVFRLDRDPVTDYAALAPADRGRFANNAHVKRETVDAAVLLSGDPDGSRLLDRAVPLSSRTAGADPNRIVTDLSADSGKGPWWRRPLRFDEPVTAELLDVVESGTVDRCFAD
ncbi:Nmad3 family putative nucleotide modification protein [Halostella litorea]|uniref:Nmad3 family putative nucleotide modification protein n=1 Tax=Halostella litorea TaxID=2528831 RepID=UPI0010927B64|nr:hypothetical protein [Halostella litorea]